MAKLNQRQLLACENLLSGMSQAEAYRQAGYKAKAPEQEASKLFGLPHISQYLGEKRAKTEAETEWTRAQAIEVLKNVALADESGSARVSAVAQAAKMLGWNAPEKHEVEAGNKLAAVLAQVRNRR